MRILLLVGRYLPSTSSSAKLIHDLASEIRYLGHEALVAVPDNSLTVPNTLEIQDGVRVIRVRSGQTKSASKIVRAINEWRLSSLMWKGGCKFFRENPCDLIVYYCPTIFWGALVRRLKKLWGCPSYLILRDIFPQWALDVGLLKKRSLAYQFFRHKELKLYETADVIGVQSPENLRYFYDQNIVDSHKIEVLYNWMRIPQDIPLTNYRKRLGLQDKLVFFYGGNIGVAQDMDSLVRLAESLREEPNIHFLIVGNGTEIPRLKKLVEAKELTNFSIYPAVDQHTYLGMLSEFDVGLITLDHRLKTQNFPGKMLGYMYSSMPILANINPGKDLKDILEENNAGLVCVNGQVDELKNYVLQLSRDANLRRRLGNNGRRLLETRFSASKATEQILSHFTELS